MHIFNNTLRPCSSEPQITVCISVTQLQSVSSDDEELNQSVIQAAPVISQQAYDALHSEPPFEDIRDLLESTKSTETNCQFVSNLFNEAKHSLLCHHKAPPNILPTTYSHGCNHKLLPLGLHIKYPFLLYSPKLNGVFCGYVHFSFLVTRER